MAATIQLRGEARGAVSALQRVKQEVRETGSALGSFGRQAAATGLGVFGFGAATESARRAIELTGRAIAAYGEANAEAGEYIAGTKERLTEFTASLGEALVGGDNLKIATGAVNAVLADLSAMLEENKARAQELVRNGIAFAVRALGTMAEAGAIAINTGRAFKLAWDGAKIAMMALSAALVSVGTAITQATIEPIDLALQKIRELIHVGAQMADRFGQEGLAGRLREVATSFHEGAEGAQAMQDRIAAMREGLAGGLRLAIEDYRRELLASGNAMVGTSEAAAAFADRMDALAASVVSGASAQHAYRLAARGVTEAIEEQNAAMQHGYLLSAQIRRGLEINAALQAKEGTNRAAALAEEQKRRDAESAIELANKEKLIAATQREAEARRGLGQSAAETFLVVTDGSDKLLKAHAVAEATMMAASSIRHGLAGTAMLFIPGQQAQGAALIAVAIQEGARAAQAGIQGFRGAGGGGGGGGNTGGGGGNRIFAPNITISGGGGGGDGRSTAALVENAIRRSYLQLEAGR